LKIKNAATKQSLFAVHRLELAPELLAVVEEGDGVLGCPLQPDAFAGRLLGPGSGSFLSGRDLGLAEVVLCCVRQLWEIKK
jgi:hypothetical protein